jgi:hypothetical protein
MQTSSNLPMTVIHYCTLPSFGQPRIACKGVDEDRGTFPSVNLLSKSSLKHQVHGKLSEISTETA